MITLDKIRADMEKSLEIDKAITSVEVIADTLEDALSDASVQLDSEVKDLEYEVLEKGSQGILGLAKKPWKIKVYENPLVTQEKAKTKIDLDFSDDELAQETKVVNMDGAFFVRHFSSSIYLKVVLPVGEGRNVSEKEVINAVKRSDTLTFDDKLIKELCKHGSPEYQAVGTYAHVAAGDAILSVDVTKDELSATIVVSAPSMSGADISADQIYQSLKVQNVTAGILDDKITEFVDNPVYNVPYEVAAAVLPVDGRDAYIAYQFETDQTQLRLKQSKNGQVNFKELNLIQNVVAGQPLAQKMLPQRGKIGKTVLGRMLDAKNGKDMNVQLGKNVKFDTDGRTIIAECNGHVMLVAGKINVEEVYEVPGVNIKTGNITYMGTVVCKGNVEDGFSIKADGNIEIYGSVGNCTIEAEGDIVISAGVMGRDEGTITTPKSVWASFIQNAKVEAGEYVVVNDNIMNSNVTAMKKIILKGKRAQIIGGHLFATEEITAKNIGSPGGGTETILEVGFDPKAKKRLSELQEMQANLVKQLEDVDLNIATLENNKKIRKALPKEKEEQLKNCYKTKQDITEQSNTFTEEIEQINSRLRELRVIGKVNASENVYAGTKVYVRDEKDEVKNNVKAVTFYYDNHFVKRAKYNKDEVTEDIKAPDGYSSN